MGLKITSIAMLCKPAIMATMIEWLTFSRSSSTHIVVVPYLDE